MAEAVQETTVNTEQKPNIDTETPVLCQGIERIFVFWFWFFLSSFQTFTDVIQLL